MIDLIRILYSEGVNALSFTINYNIVKTMSIKAPDQISIWLENREVLLNIVNEEEAEDINATKKAFQAILNAIEVAPGGRVTTVVFPPNVQCVGVIRLPY